MVELNQPQIWTLIGVFAASTIGMMGLVSTLFLRVMDARFERLEAVMEAKFERVDERFERVGERFERLEAVMEAKFEQFGAKMDSLDRDVQTLFRRVFPHYPEAG